MMELKSRKIERYGWIRDLPDARDFKFDRVMDQATVPRQFDLWPDMPPIFDQSQLGSCTGNGWARAMQKLLMSEGTLGAGDFLSRLFIYYYERVLQGTVSQDSGAQIRDGASVVAKYGAPPETDWPYDIARFADAPPQQAIDDAAHHLALVYKRLEIGAPGAPMRSAVWQGFPVVFGFPVPDYFEDPLRWDPTSQPLPIPGANVNYIGGHCVVVTGFDFTMTKYKMPVFICDNSWGANWGMGGRFVMDYRWFSPQLNLASDLWIVEKVA